MSECQTKAGNQISLSLQDWPKSLSETHLKLHAIFYFLNFFIIFFYLNLAFSDLK